MYLVYVRYVQSNLLKGIKNTPYRPNEFSQSTGRLIYYGVLASAEMVHTMLKRFGAKLPSWLPSNNVVLS
jgi:hypothetical protein